MDGGDGSKVLWIYFMLKDDTLKNGYSGKCYVYFTIIKNESKLLIS